LTISAGTPRSCADVPAEIMYANNFGVSTLKAVLFYYGVYRKKKGIKMANELHEKADAETIGQRSQADNSFNKQTSGQQQAGDQTSDAASVWKDRYIRLLADLENTKKRLARAAAQEVERQKEKLLDDVLQVSDGLDLALLNISSENDSRNILQGIELLRDILDKFFVKYDVTVIAAWGEMFDPNLHDAIGMVQHPTATPNTVVRVERKGYLYRGKLLRPAQVLVAAG